MRNQNSELDAFKREIDLREFAVSLGYEIDRHESWRGNQQSAVLAEREMVRTMDRDA